MRNTRRPHAFPDGVPRRAAIRPRPNPAANGVSTFALFDEAHSEMSPRRDTFGSFDDALAEVRRRVAVPWDQYPNRAPCRGWATCGRDYVIREYHTGTEPWTFVRAVPVVWLSAAGITWTTGFDPGLPPS